MRIVIFTIDDVEFVPDLLQGVLDEYGDQIVAAFISKTLFSAKKIRRKLPFFIRNMYPFCIKITDLLRYVGWRARLWFSGKNGARNMSEFFEKTGIRASYINEINSPSSREILASLDADVFLFVPFDKIAKREFISIPRLGTFNVHLGKLPEYRGGLSSFWVLRFNESEAGATMHRVVEEIDAGEIVAEVRFPIATDSMKQLMKETVQRASGMIVGGLQDVAAGKQPSISIDNRGSNYYLYPTRRDFQEFYRYGNRLI